MAQLPKGGLVRDHDKPIHGSCAIYFPDGIYTKNIFYWGLCEGNIDYRQEFIEVNDQWNANMFFLAEGLSFEFWDNFLLQFVRCISGNSELHSNQLPWWGLSCFPIWQIEHGKSMAKPSWYHAIGIPPAAYLVFVYVYLYLLCIYMYICLSHISSIVYGLLNAHNCQRRFLAGNCYPICNSNIWEGMLPPTSATVMESCVLDRWICRFFPVFFFPGVLRWICQDDVSVTPGFGGPVLFFFMDLFLTWQIVVTGCCEKMWDVIRTWMFWSNGIYQEREGSSNVFSYCKREYVGVCLDMISPRSCWCSQFQLTPRFFVLKLNVGEESLIVSAKKKGLMEKDNVRW